MESCDTITVFCPPFQPPNKIFYICISIVALIFLKYFLYIIKTLIPLPIFFYTAGVIVGLLHITKFEISPGLADFIFLPPLIINVCLKTDINMLLRQWKQSLIIGLGTTLIQSLLMQVLIYYLFFKSEDLNWGKSQLLAILLCVNCPVLELEQLTEKGAIATPIILLLQAEITLGTSVHFSHFQLTYQLESERGLNALIDTEDPTSETIQIVLFDMIFGFLIGKLLTLLWHFGNRHVVHVITIHFVTPFIGYYISRSFLQTTGIWFLLVVGGFYSVNRKNFTPFVDTSIAQIWSLTTEVQRHLFMFYGGALFAKLILRYWNSYDLIYSLLIYVSIMLTRFMVYLLVTPLILATGFRLSLQKILITAAAIHPNPIFPLLMINLFKENKFFQLHRYCCLTLCGLIYCHTIFTRLLNLTIVKFTKFSEYTIYMRSNMNRAMLYLNNKKLEYIDNLKSEIMFSDANWVWVEKLTTIKHPYGISEDLEATDFEESKITCPECLTEFHHSLSVNEQLEKIRMSRKQLLMARKYSYIICYREKRMSTFAQRYLINMVEEASYTIEKTLDMSKFADLYTLQDLKMGRGKKLYDFLVYDTLGQTEKPTMIINMICYFLVKYYITDLVILCLSFHFSFLFISTVESSKSLCMWCYAYSVEVAVIALALIDKEFKLHFLWKIVRNGSIFFNVCLILFHVFYSLMSLELDVYKKVRDDNNTPPAFVRFVFDFIHTLKILNVFKRMVCLPLKNHLHKWLVRRSRLIKTSNATKAYELGRSFIDTEFEIMMMLNKMMLDDEVKSQLHVEIQDNIFIVNKCLAYIGRTTNWIATTIQTKYIFSCLVKEMEEAIKDLRNRGWADTKEAKKLTAILIHKNQRIFDKIKYIQCPRPKEMFYSIAWLCQDMKVNDRMFENVQHLVLNPGDVLVDIDEKFKGIYLVVTGLLSVTYCLSPGFRLIMANRGELPIIDYLNIHFMGNTQRNFLSVGCTCGEIAYLTKRKSNGKITAEVHSQVLFIPEKALNKALEECQDPLYGIEPKIWKSISLTFVQFILKQRKSYLMLQNSVMPDLSMFTFLVLDPRIEHVILLEGRCMNTLTKDIYTGPYYVPRNVHKLTINVESMDRHLDLKPLKPRILFIIKRNVNEYDVMAQTFEMSMKSDHKPSLSLHSSLAINNPGENNKIFFLEEKFHGKDKSKG